MSTDDFKNQMATGRYKIENGSGHLKTAQFVTWMLVFIGIMLGFFYFAFSLHENRIHAIEVVHVESGQELAQLEAIVPLVQNDIAEIKKEIRAVNEKINSFLKIQANTIDIVGEMSRSIRSMQ